MEIAAIIVASIGALIAILSWLVSRSSAKAAQRSAHVAEESLMIQRREAEAAADARLREQIADVVALHWDGRAGREHRGLVIRNNGPAIARNIKAYEKTGGNQIRKWEWTTLSPEETTGLIQNEMAVSGEEAIQIGSPPPGTGCFARLEWQNADGTNGLANWCQIQRQM